MQITTVAVTYGRKFNLGNYNQAHVEVSLTADIEATDNVPECESALRQMCRDAVKNEYARLKAKHDADPTD